MIRSGFLTATTLLALATCTLAGCGTLGGSTTTRLQSAATGDTLAPALPIRVYASRDRSSADFYLTDIPEDLWNLESDLRNVSGVIVHVTMFVEPKSGRTPIATTAMSGTTRWLVLSNGEVGLYGGGGFVDVSGEPGDPSLRASMRDGSVRLVRATPGFRDRIGNGLAGVSADAAKDPERVKRLSALMEALQNEAALLP